ncbi:hypothetical protein AMAG_13872 [Allomyces macrogynus ATCC 38327]|uniref:tRNA/rRNA methyltransferase SpoU type domain-containing protein n=1 Tax=Allomyces macrogynus (strain ATCC 38327) TaxID=578462 RepID=A0A0L0T2T1_ALLM3|nr:hypothetical protein AMAG_13872 [Allomyces macrogynus ATCC 38327]|eukprot:KNE68997.1 hypothetical protein AMAG_13872 [Allomyces macrogynus ATCC 38327]
MFRTTSALLAGHRRRAMSSWSSRNRPQVMLNFGTPAERNNIDDYDDYDRPARRPRDDQYSGVDRDRRGSWSRNNDDRDSSRNAQFGSRDRYTSRGDRKNQWDRDDRFDRSDRRDHREDRFERSDRFELNRFDRREDQFDRRDGRSAGREDRSDQRSRYDRDDRRESQFGARDEDNGWYDRRVGREDDRVSGNARVGRRDDRSDRREDRFDRNDRFERSNRSDHREDRFERRNDRSDRRSDRPDRSDRATSSRARDPQTRFEDALAAKIAAQLPGHKVEKRQRTQAVRTYNVDRPKDQWIQVKPEQLSPNVSWADVIPDYEIPILPDWVKACPDNIKIRSRNNPMIKHMQRVANDNGYRQFHEQVVLFSKSAIRDVAKASKYCHPSVRTAILSTSGAYKQDRLELNWTEDAYAPFYPEGRPYHRAIGGDRARWIASVDSDTLDGLAIAAYPPFIRARARSMPIGQWFHEHVPRYSAPVDAKDPVLRVLVLNKITDEGTMGALIRSATVLGWDAVLIAGSMTDPLSPKSMRASKGGVVLIPWRRANWEEIATLVDGQRRAPELSSEPWWEPKVDFRVFVAGKPVPHETDAADAVPAESTPAKDTEPVTEPATEPVLAVSPATPKRPTIHFLVVSNPTHGYSGNPIRFPQLQAKTQFVQVPLAESTPLNALNAPISGAMLMWHFGPQGSARLGELTRNEDLIVGTSPAKMPRPPGEVEELRKTIKAARK